MLNRLLTSRNMQITLLTMLLASALFALFADMAFIERLRFYAFDSYNRIIPRHNKGDVVLIGVDQETTKHMAPTGMTTRAWADTIGTLHEMGASSITVDAVFLYSSVEFNKSKNPGEAPQMSADDMAFTNNIKDAGNTVFAFMTVDEDRNFNVKKTFDISYHGAEKEYLERMFLTHRHFIASTPVYTSVAAGNGLANFIPEKDGILRRFPMMLSRTDENNNVIDVWPALSLEAIRVSLGADTPYEVYGSGLHGIKAIKVGPYTIPTDKHGIATVYYAGKGKRDYFSLWQLINGMVDPEKIRGKAVIIGATSENMKDTWTSPLSSFTYGVEAHAEIMEQILGGQFLIRPDHALYIEALCLVLLSLAAILMAQQVNVLFLGGVMAALISAVYAGTLLAYARAGWMIDPFFACGTAGIIFTLAAILASVRSNIISSEKSRFLALMSHEIRTPMTGILGVVEFMREDDLDREEQLEYINTISECSKTLLNTLNDVLDVSKLEEGKLEISNINYNIHQVLQNARDVLSRMAQNKGITLSVDIEETVPQMAYGDPHRIKQIVMNLMNNAIKFTAKGGVTLHCSFKNGGTGPGLRVEVRDTGIGISEKNMKKLFQGFSQADSTIARKYGGTGLGLSIAKDLVQLMGGKVGVESTVGQGSTFWFEIPYTAPTAEDTESEKNLVLSSLNILLAEDNKVNQQVAHRLLTSKGHTVSIADDGGTVVEMVQEKDYDIVLMDVNMPVKNGLEATWEIRRLGGKYKDIPIIALTAHVVEEHIRRCFKAGMNAYVAKPFSLKEITAAMAGCLPDRVTESREEEQKNTDDGLNDNLREIRNQLGEAYLQQFIDNAIGEAENLMTKGRNAFENNDTQGIERAMHDLKNVSGMIGMTETNRLSILIESMCRNGENTALPDIMQMIGRACSRELRKKRQKE